MVFGTNNPRVGLLNVGGEASKGNAVLKETYCLLESAPVNFIGNAEGNDVFDGDFDVIVCDGFVGNVAVKLAEGVMEALLDIVEERVGAHMSPEDRERALMPAMAELRELTDYQSVGGGVVLGLNGVSAIAHGRSTAKAMVSIIEQAKRAAEGGLVDAIRAGCQSLGLG